MGKKAWFGLSLMLLLVIECCGAGLNPIWAEGYRVNVDFGKARPFENLVIDRSLSIKTVPGENRVKVDYDSYLISPSGERIPINRLKLAINDRTFDLDDNSFEVDLKQISPDSRLFLMFSLNLTPVDHPGCYKGTVTIRTTVKTIFFQLLVEVEPWVRMQTDQSLIGLDQTMNESFMLQSSDQLTVKVASNTSWILSVNLVKDLKIPLKIKLSQQQERNDLQNLQPSGVLLEPERKGLVVGNSTVSPDSYWAEINLLVFIDDFTKYPAGKHLFQLRFVLEQWDKKTVNP